MRRGELGVNEVGLSSLPIRGIELRLSDLVASPDSIVFGVRQPLLALSAGAQLHTAWYFQTRGLR
eukprot:gene20096-biopygen6507